MVLLHSEIKKLGGTLPDFELAGVDGRSYSSETFKDKKVLVVMFICNHCPYVQAVEDRLIQLQRDYASKSVQLIGICANDPTDYPDDAPQSLARRAKEKDYRFPYLVDENQEVAKRFGAVCTPEFYVYGPDRRLAYHGQLDDNWKEPSKVSRRDLREAVDSLLAGDAPSQEQTPSMGCSIKWKKG